MPLFAINRAAETGDLTVPLELAGGEDVLEQPGLVDLHGGVVAPLVGVADSRLEVGQLLEGFGARGVIHPLELLDPALERRVQVCDQLVHLGLALWWEELRCISLAKGFAHVAVKQGHAALPAIALGRHAPQGFGEEFE